MVKKRKRILDKEILRRAKTGVRITDWESYKKAFTSNPKLRKRIKKLWSK